MRWDPLPIPAEPMDFIEGLTTLMGAGDGSTTGLAIHLYTANSSMEARHFYNADGEMLFVPQQGRPRLLTELGTMDLSPNEIAVARAAQSSKWTSRMDPAGDIVLKTMDPL